MKIKDDFAEIRKEISKHTLDTAIEFMRIFPCHKKNYFIQVDEIVKKKEYKVVVMVKGRQVGVTTMSSNLWNIGLPKKHYIACASVSEFWERRNRFEKLRAFL